MRWGISKATILKIQRSGRSRRPGRDRLGPKTNIDKETGAKHTEVTTSGQENRKPTAREIRDKLQLDVSLTTIYRVVSKHKAAQKSATRKISKRKQPKVHESKLARR